MPVKPNENDITSLALNGTTDLPFEIVEAMQQQFNEAQISILLQKTPKRHIKKRDGKAGKKFSYVEHGYVTEVLNLAFAWNWDFEVLNEGKPLILNDRICVVFCRLTVRTKAGETITKTQYGEHEAAKPGSMTQGSMLKSAASDGLKKCASLVGVALDLYRGEEDEGYEYTGSGQNVAQKPVQSRTGQSARADAPDVILSKKQVWRTAKKLGWVKHEGDREIVDAQIKQIYNKAPDKLSAYEWAEFARFCQQTLTDMEKRYAEERGNQTASGEVDPDPYGTAGAGAGAGVYAGDLYDDEGGA